jgi:hypothetical protein
MTQRDRILVLVLAVAALVGGFWFAVLAPEREEAKSIGDQVAKAQTRLEAARRSAAQARQAKARYDSDYAAVTRLGKAVPVDDDVPSLVFQLERAADGVDVDFRAFKSVAGPAPGGAATSGIGAVAQAGTAVKSNGASDGGAASPATAAATQSAAATLPPGATVGSAGFPTMPFSFAFQGSFFDMQRLLGNVQRLVTLRGDRIRVDGRLMTIDGFALEAGDDGFPQVKASLAATAYLLPAAEGSTGGATALGPAAPSTAASSGPGGSSATTTATATGVK